MRIVALYKCYPFAFFVLFRNQRARFVAKKNSGGLWENLFWSDEGQSPDDNDLAKAQTNKRIHAYITKAINALV